MGLNYGYKYTLSYKSRKRKGNNYIPTPKKKVVIQYDSLGNEFSRFESTQQAAKGLNILPNLVSHACLKNRNKNLDELENTKGFYLKYEEDLNNSFNHF